MTEPEINLNLRAALGAALALIGLLLLAYVAWTAIVLANGTLPPLRVQVWNTQGQPLVSSPETQLILGIIVQIGMFAVLVAVASTLLKYGLSVARKG